MDKANSRYYMLSSIDYMHSIMARLTIPSDDEICPMTQEPMATYELEFAPNLTMIPDMPAIKKITLPCEHSFSAMACMYHFAKNQMRCPLCREGVDAVMDTYILPEHIKPSIISQINRVQHEDRESEEMENYQNAVMLMLDNLQDNVVVFSQHSTVVLVVYCYDESDLFIPLISFDYELRVNIQSDTIEFDLSHRFLRSLNMSLAMSNPLHVVEFAIGIRTAARDFIFIDRSVKLDLHDILDGGFVSAGRGGAFFNIECDNQVRTNIVQFKWTSGLANFSMQVQRQGSFLLSSY